MRALLGLFLAIVIYVPLIPGGGDSPAPPTSPPVMATPTPDPQPWPDPDLRGFIRVIDPDADIEGWCDRPHVPCTIWPIDRELRWTIEWKQGYRIKSVTLLYKQPNGLYTQITYLRPVISPQCAPQKPSYCLESVSDPYGVLSIRLYNSDPNMPPIDLVDLEIIQVGDVPHPTLTPSPE